MIRKFSSETYKEDSLLPIHRIGEYSLKQVGGELLIYRVFNMAWGHFEELYAFVFGASYFLPSFLCLKHVYIFQIFIRWEIKKNGPNHNSYSRYQNVYVHVSRFFWAFSVITTFLKRHSSSLKYPQSILNTPYFHF